MTLCGAQRIDCLGRARPSRLWPLPKLKIVLKYESDDEERGRRRFANEL